PAERPPGQRADDPAGTRLLVVTAGRAAHENPPPARRVLRYRPVEGSRDPENVYSDSGNGFERGRQGIRERPRHHPRSRRDGYATLELVVSGHPIFVDLLPFDVVFGDRDHRSGIETLEPAADPEAPDQGAVHPQLDLAFLFLDTDDRSPSISLQQQLEDV